MSAAESFRGSSGIRLSTEIQLARRQEALKSLAEISENLRRKADKQVQWFTNQLDAAARELNIFPYYLETTTVLPQNFAPPELLKQLMLLDSFELKIKFTRDIGTLNLTFQYPDETFIRLNISDELGSKRSDVPKFVIGKFALYQDHRYQYSLPLEPSPSDYPTEAAAIIILDSAMKLLAPEESDLKSLIKPYQLTP